MSDDHVSCCCREEGAACAFMLVALGVWARETWQARMRRIFKPRNGCWYCVECGARQDHNPETWPGVWHLERCPLGPGSVQS